MAQETKEEKIARLEMQLTNVRQSIADAEESSSLNAFGRSITRANLDTLYKREKEIERKLEILYDDDSTGGLKYARFRY